jgi:hypothetical protein
MTDETHTGENAGAGESTADDSNAASKCGDSISVSRRDVLRGGAALGLSPLFGTVSGVSDVDLDTVTWTAQNRTLKGREVTDGDPMNANPAEWYLAHATNTQLQYLGAQWEPFGNPNANHAGDGDWHLRHTFVLTSYSLALRPWLVPTEKYAQPAERMDWVPAVKLRDLPEHVSGYLKEKHPNPKISDEVERLKWAEELSTGTEFEIKTLRYWSGENDDDVIKPGESTDYPTAEWDWSPMVDNVAISVRRDSDLFGFADPKSFWRAVFHNEDSFSEEDGNDLTQLPPDAPGLEILNNHVENPTSAQYRDVRETEMNDRVDQVLEQRQDAEEQQDLYNWFESSTGLALGITGLAASGPAAPLVTAGGLALSVWGWLGSTASVLRSEATEAPPYKGVYQPYSYSHDYPAAASFVMFDVYVNPEDAGIDPMSKSYFTVRTRHEDSADSSALDEENIWVVTFDQEIPDGPNDDYDPEKLHSARIVPPNQAETQLEHGSKDAHRITYDENDEIVTFRPEPTFSIEPEAPRAGDEVTFDPRNTMIGGAPIAKYEWDLRKFTQSRAGPDAEPTGQPRPISLPDDQKGAESNIFDSETEGVVQKRLNQPGRYEMKLTVWDEHDVSGEGYTVSKPFEVKPDAEMDLSVRIPDAPPTVAAGQPTTFEAEITDRPAAIDIASTSLLNGEKVWIYEWDVLQNYEQFRPPGGVSPAFDNAEKVLDPTFEHAFERPGEYEVFVKVTDPLTGADGRYNVPVTVTEEPSYELAAGDEPHEYQLVTDSVTDSLTVRLEEPDSADFNLYATLDGRTPTVHDHDRRSYTSGDVEQITFHESEVGPIPDIKLIVSAYQGRGNYTLTVENEPDARLEYLGGDETPQDDEDDE